MRFCNQGDLENYMKIKKVKYFEEIEAVNILKQILNGFMELRKHKVLHRDFKLANIFMDNDILVIGDFGLSKQGDFGSTVLGSPLTMSPELLMPSEGEDKPQYNSKADLWSIGVVYYQLLFSDPPFFGVGLPELIKSIKSKAGENLTFPRPISPESE